MIKTYECKRCHHEWVARKPFKPITCPKCRSAYWDITKIKEANTMAKIEIPDRFIPSGAKLIEAYEYDDEFVIIGEPPNEYPEDYPEDRKHNCDFLGCGSLSHVLLRIDKKTFGVRH
ncbi:MAG: hypothetical protein WC389_16940 [Lutibacter sp.]|jgi:hypothetical protein